MYFIPLEGTIFEMAEDAFNIEGPESFATPTTARKV